MSWASILLLAVSVTPPAFPDDFYSGVQNNIAIAQGDVVRHDEGEDAWEQGTMNRTLTRGGSSGTQMKWYGAGVDKEMALLPGSAVNSSHTWACGLYCPLRGQPFQSLVKIAPAGERVNDLGMKNVTQTGLPGGLTKLAHGYGWTERLFKIIPMAKYVMWVAKEGNATVPFFSTEVLEPFGKQPPIGFANISFVSFTPKDVADQFDIDMDSVRSCKRQEQGKCPGDPPEPGPGPPGRRAQEVASVYEAEAADEAEARLEAMLMRRGGFSFGNHATILDAAIDAAAGSGSGAAGDPKMSASGSMAALPSFPSDYTSEESSILLISQGGVPDSAGNQCCSGVQAGQCQVQQQRASVTRFVDVTNQRLRTDDSTRGQVIVEDFAAGKLLNVNVSASGEVTCVSYCPINPGETLRGLVLPDNAKDGGAATVLGKSAELYTWKETILHVIPMASYQFYVRPGAPNATLPLLRVENLTPLGRPSIGTSNTTYTQFTPGLPPAEKFDIRGVDTCKAESPMQCSGPGLQAHRLATGQHLTWAMYEREWP